MTVKYTATDGATDEVTVGNPAAIREGLLGLLATYDGICNAIWSAKYDLLPPKGGEEETLQKTKRLIIKRLCSYPEGKKIWEGSFEYWKGDES